MKKVLGLVHQMKNEGLLKSITHHRCMAAVPFGGKYRLVDFVLSNMVNAGIDNIGLVTPAGSRSIMDHLGGGRGWGLDKKHGGLVFLPSANGRKTGRRRIVDLRDFYHNLDFLENREEEELIISGSNVVCNIDYHKVFQGHLDTGADITVVCSGGEKEGQVFLDADEGGRIHRLIIGKNKKPDTQPVVSLDMYLLKKELLVDILRECADSNRWDLIRDVLAKRVEDLDIRAFFYDGYFAVINSLASYYRCQMELLSPQVLQELFFANGPICTKWKDGPPSKYYRTCRVSNSLIANGCQIAGVVENSVVFRKVKIEEGAIVRNSIIMPKVKVQAEAYLDGVILDKGVAVGKGVHLKAPKGQPVVVERGATYFQEGAFI